MSDIPVSIRRGLLCRCVAGSRAHGTAVDSSDHDTRGVYANSRFDSLLPFGAPDEWRSGEGRDEVLHELRKFVRMACEQHPGAVELLWTDPSDVIEGSEAWDILVAARTKMLTTQARATFKGFAMKARSKISARAKWTGNPMPEERPVQKDFVHVVADTGLGSVTMPVGGSWTAVRDGHGRFNLHEGGSGTWYNGNGSLRLFFPGQVKPGQLGPSLASCFFDAGCYEARKLDHGNYWRWVRERNPSRTQQEAEYGADMKDAAAAVRNLRMANEIMSEGIVRVRRPDAAHLVAIRTCQIPLGDVLAELDALEASLETAAATTGLPAEVDAAAVGDAVCAAYESVWERMAARKGGPPGRRLDRSGGPDLRGRVVVLDIEGTGWTDPGRFRVVELGAVEIKGGRVTGRSFHSYVSPGSRVNGFARGIHGLGERFLGNKPGLAAVAPAFLAFVGESPVVATDAASDARMLNPDLLLAGFDILDPGRMACSQRIARAVFGETLGLDAICDRLGVDRTPRTRGHSALLDANLLAEALLAMSEMPGYAGAKGCWLACDTLLTRKERSASRKAAASRRAVSAELLEGCGEVRFVLADGTELRSPVQAREGDRVRVSKEAVVVSPAGGGTTTVQFVVHGEVVCHTYQDPAHDADVPAP